MKWKLYKYILMKVKDILFEKNVYLKSVETWENFYILVNGFRFQTIYSGLSLPNTFAGKASINLKLYI
jgi:hypothetical protein